MMKRISRYKESGSVLILALWTLVTLSIFSIYIGLRLRQRIALLAHIETKSQLHYVAEAGVKKAISALRLDWQRSDQKYSADSKAYRHNNMDKFSNITVGSGICDVKYIFFDGVDVNPQLRYGFIDEERKININVVDRNTLRNLIEIVLSLHQDDAQTLAESIIEWRERTQRQLTGFYSDDFYASLQYPYERKKSDYERIEELLLVRGVSQEAFDRLAPFLTVYGDGLVNINTAPREVLLTLGLDGPTVDKLLSVRRGLDGVEDTTDDYVFQRTYDIASEMANLVKLEENEIKRIDVLNAAGIIKTNSFYYFIQSYGRLENRGSSLSVVCVYDVRQNRIVYWKEK